MWHLRELPVHGGAEKEVRSLLRYWLKTTTAYLSFSDGRHTWPWVTIRHSEIPTQTPHSSQFCLFRQSAAGSLFYSFFIVLNCPPFLIHHPNGVLCQFKAWSDSHCGNGHMLSLGTHSWSVWFLPFLCSARLIFEGEFRNLSKRRGISICFIWTHNDMFLCVCMTYPSVILC